MMKTKPYSGAYSALGGIFEYLNDDCGYEQWSQYLIEKLRGAGKRGVDVGCGNGYFTRALYKAGYDVKGIDISPQMLSTAVELARKESVSAEFLLGDIAKLSLNFKADFITAVNDCINYVAPKDITSAFSRVNKCLKKGGTFIFDISSPHKLQHILGDNLFAEDRGDIAYMWFNKLFCDRVEMDITVFTKQEGGSFLRADEQHTQYIYTEEQLKELLESAGFEVQTEGHLGGDKNQRINFICKKYE
ncbi:MAG: class I SAM-dependent methyltransferase [Clostridia bacterium]|nr:class I SAM-dependent methyltransferase [Clostridia bacterium]